MWITKDGSGNQTSVHLNEKAQILLGSNPNTPSTEPFTLGNVVRSIMDDVLNKAMTNLKVGTAVGPSSPPLNLPEFLAANLRFQTNEHSSDFIFGRKTY